MHHITSKLGVIPYSYFSIYSNELWGNRMCTREPVNTYCVKDRFSVVSSKTPAVCRLVKSQCTFLLDLLCECLLRQRQQNELKAHFQACCRAFCCILQSL